MSLWHLRYICIPIAYMHVHTLISKSWTSLFFACYKLDPHHCQAVSLKHGFPMDWLLKDETKLRKSVALLSLAHRCTEYLLWFPWSNVLAKPPFIMFVSDPICEVGDSSWHSHVSSFLVNMIGWWAVAPLCCHGKAEPSNRYL